MSQNYKRWHGIRGRKFYEDLMEIGLLRSKLQHFRLSVVEWLKRWARDQHGLGSKPTRAILLCPWERHFATLSLGGLGKQI